MQRVEPSIDKNHHPRPNRSSWWCLHSQRPCAFLFSRHVALLRMFYQPKPSVFDVLDIKLKNQLRLYESTLNITLCCLYTSKLMKTRHWFQCVIILNRNDICKRCHAMHFRNPTGDMHSNKILIHILTLTITTSKSA